MKIVKQLFQKRWFWAVIVALFTIPTFSALIRPGFFPMHDDLQAFRFYEMDKCFADFQIPCRWVPDAGYGYGYPQFNYYPPSVYYIGEALHLLGIGFIDTTKILFAAGLVLSALAMFLLVSEMLGNFPGFVSAMLYTFVPYKAVEVYVRGAMSEFWSLVFYPLIFWAVYKLIKTLKTKYIALLALSIGMLLTTHLLMSMIFVLPAAIWTIYWLVKENKLAKIGKVAAGVALGVGFAAFFILPVIFEGKYAHTETLTMGYFGYLQHFVNVFKLFISREWGYGSSGFPNEKLNLSTGLIQWTFALVAFALGAFYIFVKKKNKEMKDWSCLLITLSIMELSTLFMIHVKSSFIWKLFPFLAWLQFPWRFLSVSIFLLAIIGGIGIHLLPKFKKTVGISLVALAIILNYSYFVPKDWINITDAEKFSGASWQKQLTISIFDYLPIYAKLPPISAAPETPEVLQGKAEFTTYVKGSDFQKGKVLVLEDAVIRLPIFDFPGMRVRVDGDSVPHVNNDCRGQEFCLGLVTFNLPMGEHEIEVELEDTPVRRVGNYLSLVSLLVIGWILVKKSKE
ncbi:MAG: hypothetical protein ACD_13C00119G0006 [uncultured bacterium]|nr:MAG: hypothetical protein ACD_13C00119G0006 [uncultured bacterium]